MNFLKKIIGLSMAVIMAFGGFAADAVKFINKTTGEFVEISRDADSLNKYYIRSVLNVYSKSKHVCRYKYIETSKDLGITFINDYINLFPNLKEFFEKNKYKADFPEFPPTYWSIEGGDLYSYKKEAIVFDDFLLLTKVDYDIFVRLKSPYDKILDINLFAK